MIIGIVSKILGETWTENRSKTKINGSRATDLLKQVRPASDWSVFTNVFILKDVTARAKMKWTDTQYVLFSEVVYELVKSVSRLESEMPVLAIH